MGLFKPAPTDVKVKNYIGCWVAGYFLRIKEDGTFEIYDPDIKTNYALRGRSLYTQEKGMDHKVPTDFITEDSSYDENETSGSDDFEYDVKKDKSNDANGKDVKENGAQKKGEREKGAKDNGEKKRDEYKDENHNNAKDNRGTGNDANGRDNAAQGKQLCVRFDLSGVFVTQLHASNPDAHPADVMHQGFQYGS